MQVQDLPETQEAVIDAEFIPETLAEPTQDENALIVPLESIAVDDAENISRHFAPSPETITRLAASIAQEGLLHAVVVKPATPPHEGVFYRLVAGFCRVKAVTELYAQSKGIPGLHFGMIRVTVQPDAGVLANADENHKRLNQSYMDVAHAAREMKRNGMKPKEIAAYFGKNVSWVSIVTRFLKLREPIQRRIHQGSLKFRFAKDLVTMNEEEQDRALKCIDEGRPYQQVLDETTKSNKTKRGRKVSKEQKATKRGVSAAEAAKTFDEWVEEGPETSQERSLYGNLSKYLTGGLSAQALRKRVREMF